MKTVKLTDKQVDSLLSALSCYGTDCHDNINSYEQTGDKELVKEYWKQIRSLRLVVDKLGFVPDF
tara:strand:+ start:92 stop:286 length:195 start_codon:yes stop_codon:yes gene_type:complete